MNLEIADFILLGCMLLGLVKGLLAGFRRELVAVFVVIIALVGGHYATPLLAQKLAPLLPDAVPASAISTMLFVVSFLTLWATANILLTLILRNAANPPGTLGRLLGGGFGALKTSVIVLVIMAALVHAPGKESSLADKIQIGSLTGPATERIPALYQSLQQILPRQQADALPFLNSSEPGPADDSGIQASVDNSGR